MPPLRSHPFCAPSSPRSSTPLSQGWTPTALHPAFPPQRILAQPLRLSQLLQSSGQPLPDALGIVIGLMFRRRARHSLQPGGAEVWKCAPRSLPYGGIRRVLSPRKQNLATIPRTCFNIRHAHTQPDRQGATGTGGHHLQTNSLRHPHEVIHRTHPCCHEGYPC